MQKVRIKAIVFTALWLAMGIILGPSSNSNLFHSAVWAGTEKEANEAKVPRAFFPEPEYNFDPVMEGTKIKHDFVVENQGQATLVIEGVEAHCNCSVATNPGQIPPGGKDKISVVVDTQHAWGQKFNKHFNVKTNDPQAPAIDLVVAGQIEPLYEISPVQVRIVGRQGDQNLSQQVRITPYKGQRFGIKSVKANRSNEMFHWALKPQGKDKQPKKGYVLTVTCDSQKVERAGDLLFLETDLEDCPAIRVPVYCNIVANPHR
ncbi:MAG: DUF1573 domain-containing protein [Desulfobacteraceae bacterium]|nr:DUF1573 domain-containing protein [Desulfobacteraceae bacterium]